MDSSAHQVAECRIDDPVTANRILAGESRRHYMNFVMAAVASTSMASVQMGFILDFQCHGLQYGQTLAQPGDGLGAHAGNTFLNGLIVTFS